MATTLTALMEFLPVGFRFHPTDQEVVINYLKPRILGIDPQVCDVIPEVDVYKWEPSELPCVFASQSVIDSDDPEWWFLCPRDFKYSNSNRSNRMTSSGYWKATGKDRKVKAKGTNNVIATKKTLVFYEGRVPKGVRTNWVMHEYQPTETFPNQRAFVICRIKNKADDIITASIFDGGEASSSNTIPAVFIQPEIQLGSLFQPHDHDFSTSQQLSTDNRQAFLEHISFTIGGQSEFGFDTTDQEEVRPITITRTNDWIELLDTTDQEEYPITFTRSNDWIGEPFEFETEIDTAEQEEDPMEFLNSLIVDPDEDSCEETMDVSLFNDSSTPDSMIRMYYGDGGISSDTDTDIAQARAFRTSHLFEEHVSTRECRQMQMVKVETGTLSSSKCEVVVESPPDIHKIDCITLDRPDSPVKGKTSKPQHQRRSHNFVALRRNQVQINRFRKAASRDKAKDAAKRNTPVNLQQKEKSIMLICKEDTNVKKKKSIMGSNKERKMAEGTNAKKEKSIMESDKERKMAKGTNSKKGLKLKTDESASSNRKGCFIFLESSLLSHESRLPKECFFNVVLGIVFFVVVFMKCLYLI